MVWLNYLPPDVFSPTFKFLLARTFLVQALEPNHAHSFKSRTYLLSLQLMYRIYLP